jgi:RimJ/RimL family protein N-acetyltransferase
LNGGVPQRRRFELSTDRLTIRMLGRDDVTAFTHYRMLPEIARYQDWPMPYTRDLAHELVVEMDALSGPTTDRWVQLAIDSAAGMVGDVAVWLDADATLAMIGYTLDPDFQGQGYAIEAVEALIAWLFRRKRVHRIAATIDPRNVASARVLERCGFEYVGTARSAAFVRGEWADDARFSLLEPDWKSWCRRPTGPPSHVELVEVTADNVRVVGKIESSFSQREFVAPVLVSLAEALVPPIEDGVQIVPWYRAISADGELVGFVMMAEPNDSTPHPYLWRLVIDVRHQGRGIGRRALEQVIADRRAAGAAAVTVSYVVDRPGSPARFYERLGFVPTGRIVDGEVEAILALSV